MSLRSAKCGVFATTLHGWGWPRGLWGCSLTQQADVLPSVRVLRRLVSGSLGGTRGIQVLLVAHGLILRAASSQTKGIVCKVRQLAFPL